METIIDWLHDSRHRVLSWFKDDVFRRLFVNAGRLATANAIAAVLGFAAAIMTARALGPENYGVMAMVLAYEVVVGRLVAFNAWQAIIKFGSGALEVGDREGLRQLIKFGFMLDVVSAIIGTILAVSLSGPVIQLLGWDQSIRPSLVVYSILILFSLSGTPIGTLRLFDRFDLLGYMVVLNVLVKLMGVGWCFVTKQGVFGFVLVYLGTGMLGQLCQVLASLWVLNKQGLADFVYQPLHGIRRRFPGILDYVWTTNVHCTVRMLSREADTLIIGGLTTPASLGLFKVAKQFSQILPMLSDPLYQSIYPELSRLWAAGRKRDFLSLIKRTTLFVSSAAICGWIGFMLLGHRLISWTVGPAYSAAYSVALIYMLALVIALSTFSFTPSMLAIGLPRKSFVALLLATTVYLVLLLVLTTGSGIIGASWSYVGFYAVWTCIMVYFLKPYLMKTTG